jgi:hypothetical protein
MAYVLKINVLENDTYYKVDILRVSELHVYVRTR